MEGIPIYLLILLIFLVSCSLAGEPLLTLIAPAVLPTQTPAPTPTWGRHPDIETLVERVAGPYISPGSLSIDYPDGRFGYGVSMSTLSSEEMSRSDVLRLAYALEYEFFFNFAQEEDKSLFLQFFASNNPNCGLNLGIGYLSVPAFLPESQPLDLEEWFQELVSKQYYGDLPGDTQLLMAFGNNPSPVPSYCDIEEWQK